MTRPRGSGTRHDTPPPGSGPGDSGTPATDLGAAAGAQAAPRPPAPATEGAAEGATQADAAPRRGPLGWTASTAPGAVVVLGLFAAWLGPYQYFVKGPLRYLGLAVVGVAALIALAALPRAWPAWRKPPVLAWVVAWAAWALSAVVGLTRLPRDWASAGRSEVVLMAAAAALGTLLLVAHLATATGPRGLFGDAPASRGPGRVANGFRWMWLAILVTTAPLAMWEITRGEHINVSPWGVGVWAFAGSAAGPFANPNNFACVLLAVVGTLLAWSLDRIRWWWSALLVLAAASAAWLVWGTLSRAATAGVAAQLVIAVVGLGVSRGWWAALWRRRAGRLLATVGALVMAGLVAAAFVVPSLAARNPLLRAPKLDEAASDNLRLLLVENGLRYWSAAPLLGRGPASFEQIQSAEKPAGVPNPALNLHNGFVEIGTQYGLLAALPLAALLLVALWCGLRRGPVAVRVEVACLFVAYVVTAVDVSSAPGFPLWFVMLAHVVARAANAGAVAALPPDVVRLGTTA